MAFKLIDQVELGLAEYRFHNRKGDEKYYRLDNSLRYFRRSIRARSLADKVIALNIAFEALLIDRDEMAKKAPLLERGWLVARLARYSTKRKLTEELDGLINERNAVVHAGHPVLSKLDFPYLNHLYARCLIRMGCDIGRMDSKQPKYIEKYFESLR